MSYIEFDKKELINLGYSLNKELIRSNRAGSYASTTIINCNTRKYHGLLICPLENFGGENHVLLSSLNETVIQRGKEFNLGIHKYPGQYNPLGHKYIREYESDPIPATVYQVGGVVLKREEILAEEEERVLIKYTLLDAHSPTVLRLKPFLAFRKVHCLSKANMYVNTRYAIAKNGIKSRLYEGYPDLYMQLSKQNEYVSAPDWYYNIEYSQEEKRGYEAHEDLFVPGYFEFSIKKGESVVFSAGLKETEPNDLKEKFNLGVEERTPRNSFEHCLENSAEQFFVRKNNEVELIAGFPWFKSWGRDTFIALPGLTLPRNDHKTCKAVLDTMSKKLDGCQFKTDEGSHSADTPLWYFWAIQQYWEYAKDYKNVWKNYSETMKSILECMKKGCKFGIRQDDNGLIYAGKEGMALTWMDAIVDGKPVTQRNGYAVEINALWYNAVCFMLKLAEKAKDEKFIAEWKDVPKKIKKSFLKIFWNDKKSYLADCVLPLENGEMQTDWAVRPNQVIATSLFFSPLNEEQQMSILEKVKQELLTPKGLRTLSPKNPKYEGIYAGNQIERDKAYHQGTVWVWLLGHFAEAYLRLHLKSGICFIERIYQGLEEEMMRHGIGTISEIFDGNPPHEAKGAISQAWSVAELLRIREMIKTVKSY